MEISGTYKIILNTDDAIFGGHNLVDTNILHYTKPENYSGRQNCMQIYIPARSALLFAKIG